MEKYQRKYQLHRLTTAYKRDDRQHKGGHHPLHRNILLTSFRELCSYLLRLDYSLSIAISVVCCSPVWIFYARYIYWLLPSSVGHILYRQSEICVWNTCGKVCGRGGRGSPFSQWSPIYWVPIFTAVPKNFITRINHNGYDQKNHYC